MSLFFFRLNRLSSHSRDAPVPQTFLRPFSGHTHTPSLCLCCTAGPELDSRCGLTSAKWSKRVTFPKLLAILCLIQMRRPFAFFVVGHIVGLCSIWCPPEPLGPFLQSCFPLMWPPAYIDALGLLLQGAGICISPIKFHEVQTRCLDMPESQLPTCSLVKLPANKTQAH